MELENIEICEDVVAFLADTITTNIRELEGSLTSLLAHASLQKQEITLEMARRVLSDTLRTKRRSVSIDQIKKQVAEVFHVEVEMLSAKKKTQTIALARQVAMYLARTLTNTSLQATGDAFGGRDHSTVIHAEKLIRRLMAEDPELAEKIKTIIRNLSGGS
jgi:chromosomal replication initiator protein